MDITLAKLKYRNPNRKMNHRQNLDPPEGTWTYSGGRFKSTSVGQGTASKVKTLAPRRKAYGPF